MCAFVCVGRFCHKMTGGFAVSKIISDRKLERHARAQSRPFVFSGAQLPLADKEPLPSQEGGFQSENRIQISDEEYLQASHLLNQPFYFYAKGGQCFIFIGADGKTIIKFFKLHHMRFWNWLSRISFPFSLDYWRVKLLKKHQHQTQSYLFQSCKTAYEKFKEQTGLLYLQFSSNPLIQQKLVIYDKLMIAHVIELSSTDFVIQKKAAPIRKTFKKLIKQNNIELCKRYIDSMLELMIERCQQGIADRDFNVRTNFGLLDDKVIEIDIGSYHENSSLKDPQSSKAELVKQTEKFKKWLERHRQELAKYLCEKIDDL
jgi:hypothetical protein